MRRSLAIAILLATLPSASVPEARAELLRAPIELGETPNPPPQAIAERLDGKKSGLVVSIDRSKVDVPGHRLEATLNHAADKLRIKVISVSGAVLAEIEKTFGGAAAGTVLAVSWTPSSEEEVAKIEVWGYDTEGFYAGVAIIPWKISVPHEELNFESDSDVIRASEAPKLEASLTKITEAIGKHTDLGKITLFVVGHTDTVGSADHNLQLSRKRARAIAGWFRAHGLKSPIAYEGLGKTSLLVKTADQVDEPRNRRVDYILALEPPPLPTGADFSWKTP